MIKPSSNQPIGVFDSGIGGLSVANAISSLLPGETIFYFGDTAHLPYGVKPLETIREYCREITSFLLDQGCKMIVVACNTASAAALGYLREMWPEVHFVGMEPAVKPGAKATISGKVGVLATRGTFSSRRYADLMHRFAKDVEVFENPCLGLVELIEDGKTSDPETEQLLRSILSPMIEKKVDTFVLGCTHYPFVKPLIEKITGPDTVIIDPAPAVAGQVAKVLQNMGLVHKGGPQLHRFFVSGDPDPFRKNAERFFLLPFSLDRVLL